MNFEKYIKNETKSLNLKYLSEETRNFIPEISGNFIEDKKFFSNFWNKVRLEKVSLKKEKKITKINIKEINTFCNITKKIFLNKYSPLIYREITNDFKTFIRVEELCLKANTVVDNLLPSFEDLEKENKLFLKDKEGLEIQQGIFLSALLKNEKEGLHLCKSMLLPITMAKDKIEEFEKKGKVYFDGASVESFEDYNLVTLKNSEYLNAEDNRTLLPLEAAIDIAIYSKKK